LRESDGEEVKNENDMEVKETEQSISKETMLNEEEDKIKD
jgi:hypothetical protein